MFSVVPLQEMLPITQRNVEPKQSPPTRNHDDDDATIVAPLD